MITASTERRPGLASDLFARMRRFLVHPLDLFRSYRRQFFLLDVLAGLTVAALMIPQAVAYASIAELPAHIGLYAAAVAAIAGALWGSSRYLSTGPTNAISMLTLSVLTAVALPGTPAYLIAAGAVALLAGVFLISLAMLKLGAVVTFASRSVLVGFATGAALLIALGQIKHLVGIELESSADVVATLMALVQRMDAAHVPTTLVGCGTLVVVIALSRIGHRVPAELIAMIAAAALVAFLGLEQQGVHVIGSVERGLPMPKLTSLIALFDLKTLRALALGAMAVAALGLVEAVAIGQSLARDDGEHIDANQEFFGLGMANLAAGFFGGYSCSGSLTRSTLAKYAGAKSRIAGMIAGVTVLLGVFLLGPYARFVPRAALAAILLVVAWRMVDRAALRRVVRTSRVEATVTLFTFAATLLLSLELAILAGILLALAIFVVQSSLPRVHAVVPDTEFRHLVDDPLQPECPQLAIMNIHGPLFFGAVHHIDEALRQQRLCHPGQHNLVLRLHNVESCDLSGVELLERLVALHRSQEGDVFLIRPRKPVLAVLKASGFLDDTLGTNHILPQEGAVEYLFDKVIDPAVCTYECEHRVFAECQAIPKHHYPDAVPAWRPTCNEPERLLDPKNFALRSADGLILDVRENDEYAGGHIVGSQQIPLRFLLERASSLPRDRDILLVCRSGRRGQRALSMLRGLGFERVFDLRGGILAWRAAGNPVETTAKSGSS